MADISMCSGGLLGDSIVVCPMRDKCYRYTAIPNEYRQSYFAVAPLKVDEFNNHSCEYFWRDEQ